jgi:hypothetical protein
MLPWVWSGETPMYAGERSAVIDAFASEAAGYFSADHAARVPDRAGSRTGQDKSRRLIAEPGRGRRRGGGRSAPPASRCPREWALILARGSGRKTSSAPLGGASSSGPHFRRSRGRSRNLSAVRPRVGSCSTFQAVPADLPAVTSRNASISLTVRRDFPGLVCASGTGGPIGSSSPLRRVPADRPAVGSFMCSVLWSKSRCAGSRRCPPLVEALSRFIPSSRMFGGRGHLANADVRGRTTAAIRRQPALARSGRQPRGRSAREHFSANSGRGR